MSKIPQIKVNSNVESSLLDKSSSSISINKTNSSASKSPLETSVSSVDSNNNSQFSNIGTHIIMGPVSLRQNNDSGLNTTPDMPYNSSSNSSANENTSNCESSNNYENSIDISDSFEHEVIGPISMRRINDSGLNISNEILQSSNDETNYAFEPSVNSFESSL